MPSVSPLDPLTNPHDRNLAPSIVPKHIQRAALVIFMVLLAVATFWAMGDHWRRSTFTYGVALAWLAAMRLTCDPSTLGFLSVRSRRFDVVFLGLVSAGMLALSSSIDALGSG